MKRLNKLFTQDKVEIFDLSKIENNFIHWKNRKIVIFEYFSNFQKSILFEIIKDKNLDFQVKIKKESFKDTKEEILNSMYFDFSNLIKKEESEFSISINDKEGREKIWKRKIAENELSTFITNEKGTDYIYRHYLIINVQWTENLEQIIYDFYESIKNKKEILFRQLENTDLEKYLFNEINYTFSENNWIQENLLTKNEEEDSRNILSIIKNSVNKIEESFFYQDLKNVSLEVQNILSQKMFKWDSYFQIWNNFKWGLVISWIPKDNFNVLKYLFSFLLKEDSVTINIYPYKKHALKNREALWVDSMFKKEDSNKNQVVEKNYLQLLINFNDLNPYQLSRRTQDFIREIWSDFLVQKIENRMSWYIKTSLWTGLNALNLELAFNEDRLKSNLIF